MNEDCVGRISAPREMQQNDSYGDDWVLSGAILSQ